MSGAVVVGASLALIVYGKVAAGAGAAYSPHGAALHAAAGHGHAASSPHGHPFQLQNGQVKHVHRCG